MAWVLNSDRPIYTQILERIQTRIISGIYKPGEKLPSVRELAAEASVNPNTMQKAFAELERSGLIQTQRNSGRTVTEDTDMIKQVQTQVALSQVQSFFSTMTQLGFNKEEILAFVKKAAEEGAE
ncbi:MAG: GntR family transcriptional regulator [Lachnospiraceae bacterium]|nr:GntR family transcriptional regulator [Lachnospiraceae bacterium]